MPEATTQPTGDKTEGGQQQSSQQSEQTFTQADVDRIVSERLKREREATKAKYGDYEVLKEKAEGAKTLEDRVTGLESQAKASDQRALRAEVAVAKGLTAEEAKRLVGETREELLADADDYLKAVAAREGERKKKAPHVPGEGRTPNQQSSDPKRDFARALFKRTD